MLEKNRESPSFELIHPITDLQVDLAEEASGGPHAFRFKADGQEIAGRASWVVRRLRPRTASSSAAEARPSEPHQARLLLPLGRGAAGSREDAPTSTARPSACGPSAATLGHFPTFLATNHYCGEGYWFWEIPLHGKTSLGLVYDSANVAFKDVSIAREARRVDLPRVPALRPRPAAAQGPPPLGAHQLRPRQRPDDLPRRAGRSSARPAASPIPSTARAAT